MSFDEIIIAGAGIDAKVKVRVSNPPIRVGYISSFTAVVGVLARSICHTIAV